MSVVDLKGALRGELIQPGDANYDDARKLYNAMIDKKPRLIAKCVDAADVMACVNYARTNKLLLAIRGGGHNGPGLGGCDDGLVIDLSRMRGVRVDPGAKTVSVAGGCVWGDVDHATHPFGMAVPSGIISTTGVGGLTLGGGIGHLSRKYGLTIDNLLAVDIVLADGRLVIANESQNPELFWALRGGGGNFGVVTGFTFRLNPAHTVTAGPIFWAIEDTPQILRKYEPFITDAPQDLNGFFALMTVPPAPPFPEALHLKKVCGIMWCSTADADTTQKWLAPVQSWAKPLMAHVGPVPLPALQSLFDGLYCSGLQWYWKADFVNELSEPAIAQHLKFGSELPTMHSAMHLYPINGAVHRKSSTDAAFSYRKSKWAEVIVGVDPSPTNAGKITRWAKDYWQAVHPYAAPGAYVNFMMEEGSARIEATYGENYSKLQQIKSKFDPENLFRVNQNISPKKN
ncbi:MAG TPA: FAD-binding oxidoreductase [Tepidisphaeraceae bacterium]|jgi:FAD/FMN-containing dehydrogenase|nr:FAD-binding oxidoreductase [Tepidisphaeraceae bacterium]